MNRLTKKISKNLSQLFGQIWACRTTHNDAVASWNNSLGSLGIDSDGYMAMRCAAELLKGISAWRTYPHKVLENKVAFALIEYGTASQDAVNNVESNLIEGLGHQRAFVPFWGLYLEDGIAINFGKYRFKKLGEFGMNEQIIKPFAEFRSGVEESEYASDIAHVSKTLQHISTMPILIVDFFGTAEGARDFVAPIAEHVAEFLQFVTGWSLQNRHEVKIIDHRGAYFGRFMTIMPVLSREATSKEPYALEMPNIRDNPYGAELTNEQYKELQQIGIETLLPIVAEGSRRGNDVKTMLLRAIQLFSDGERAVSQRQAIVAYVGACEALFGKKDEATLFTCAGMAAAMEADFKSSFKFATFLYKSRSEAVHSGMTPVDVEPARKCAKQSIQYVMNNRESLPHKQAIRKWLEPYVERSKNI